jgi:hypothetical protein
MTIRMMGLIALLLALMTSPTFAQSRPPISVVGGLDYARITEDEGFLGAGFGAILGAQFHLTRSTAVEVEVTRDRHVRDLSQSAVAVDPQGRLQPLPYTTRWEGTATFVMALVSHRMGPANAPLVVFGGGGFMTHGGTLRGPLTLPEVPPNYTIQSVDLATRRGSRSSAFTAEGGAGVDVGIHRRLIVRPFVGLRLAMTENVGPKYIVRGGVRLAFRF